MRLFISGSAPLLPETFESFRARTGHAILERYGMTETGMNTSNPLDGERMCGSVGPALPGVSVRVVDARGVACATGDVGGIEVKGPNVFAGYWRMPEKTREEFTADGYFKTGDMGRAKPDTLSLRIVGRAKDLIITRRPQRLPEGDRRTHRCAAWRARIRRHRRPRRGLRRSGDGSTSSRRRGHAAPRSRHHRRSSSGEIASFKVPKRVHIVDALPRNAMGKVEKNVLRRRYAPN